jgi:transposase
MGKYISQNIKDEILVNIKNGLTVSEASNQYQVSTKAIYRWLKNQADNTGTSALVLAKLKKENQALKEIIGNLTLEKRLGEKNQSRQKYGH